MLGFEGATLPDHVRAWLRDGLGGIFLFPPNGNYVDAAQVRRLTDTIRAANPDALIAIDQEGGRVQAWGPPHCDAIPPFGELGAASIRPDGTIDPTPVRDVARTIAGQLTALGINVDFAPVLDVHTCVNNPIIGDRAVSDDPHVVEILGREFVRELTNAGILACGKHFPGHGDTARDSHVDLPVVTRSAQQLRACELAPFAGLAAELPLIMTAHVVYPALDPDNAATHSPAILRDLLRGELGFSGLIISDDMAMKGIRIREDQPERGLVDACLRALDAGCDIVLSATELDDHESLLEQL